MTIPHEPWLVALSIAIAIQGSFVGLVARAQHRLGRGLPPQARHRRIGDHTRDRRLVDALRRHACREFPERRRLSRASDADLLPHLRPCGRNRRLCRAHAWAAGVSDRHRRLGDGPRRQPHALCRNVGGASGRTDVVRSFLCGRVHRSVDRGQRLCLMDDRQAADPAAVVPRRDRARPGDRRNALHGDGRNAPRPALLRRFAFRRRRVGAVAQHAGAARHGRGVRRVGRLSPLARAGCERAPKRRAGTGGGRIAR